jgi:hypothetical protein
MTVEVLRRHLAHIDACEQLARRVLESDGWALVVPDGRRVFIERNLSSPMRQLVMRS